MILPAYYINLDDRPDRRRFMERQFAALGINVERIAASTGSDQTGALSRPELGCFESHVMVWRRLLAGTAPAAVVLEDDVFVSTSLPAVLQSLGPQPHWFDVLRLESRRRPMRLGRPAEANLPAPITARRQLSIAAGSAGYVITRRAAQWYLSSPALFQVALDALQFRQPALHELCVMQLVPAPVIHAELRDPDGVVAASDLTSARHRDQPNLVRSLRWRLRAAAGAVRSFAPADLLAGLLPYKVAFCAPAVTDDLQDTRDYA